MTGRISTHDFKAQIQNAPDSSELRLRSDNSVTTALRSIGGRIMRFFQPSLDVADTLHMSGQLLRNLRNDYGPEVALQAFKMARSDVRTGENGSVWMQAGRPLTARQVKDAYANAEALKGENARKAQVSIALSYGPERTRFGVLAEKLGIDTSSLSTAHKELFRSRLCDLVLHEAETQRAPVDQEGVRKIATKLLKHVVGLSREEATERRDSWREMRRDGFDLVKGLAGVSGKQPIEGTKLASSLMEFLGQIDELAPEVLTGGKSGGMGGDDIAQVRYVAIANLVGAIPVETARLLYEEAMRPGSPALQLIFGLGAATSLPEFTQGDGSTLQAARELMGQVQDLLVRLGERGGVEGAGDKVMEKTDLAADITSKQVQSSQYPRDLLDKAGIRDDRQAKKALDDVVGVVRSHGKVLAERAELALQMEREGMHLETGKGPMKFDEIDL